MWEAFKLKFNLDVVVTIAFWANFMNEQTQNNWQRSRFLKIFLQNPKSQSFKAIRKNTIWIVDPFTQVKSAEHIAKFNTKSISNRGTFCKFSLAAKRKIYKTSMKHLKLGIPIDRVPTSKSCVFCLGTKFLFVFPFDRFLVSSCCKDYFLEKFSDSVWWLYKPAM